MPSRSTSDGDGHRSGEVLVLGNEFARVVVTHDTSANGSRLMIRSARTGRTVYLDPLQVESLTWLADEDYARLLSDPFGPAEDSG
ncbi:hypothetical protein [Pseudonocardia sp.]|uniref:hypothetical protein n=1 Tax=Pseudonocardia sp. TaxID=60912 RepID=UPI0026388869|nr:hypothetical protein [Pseudonocardia sp.]